MFGFSVSRAAREYGWLLALAGSLLTYVLLAGGSQVGVTAPGVAPVIVQKSVAAPPPLITALDVCSDPKAERWLVAGPPSRYEALLTKETVDLNGKPVVTRYRVVSALGPGGLSPDAAVWTTRTGEAEQVRSEPMSEALAKCLSTGVRQQVVSP